MKILNNDTDTVSLRFEDEASMLRWAQAASQHLHGGLMMHLLGTLGMGKTTLSRGFIQGLGHQGAVKSPTYTLVEPYELGDLQVYHFDLYRLADPEELEFMGVRDYFNEDSLCLVEWPDKGVGVLPAPDIQLELSSWQEGRELTLTAFSESGVKLAEQWIKTVECLEKLDAQSSTKD